MSFLNQWYRCNILAGAGEPPPPAEDYDATGSRYGITSADLTSKAEIPNFTRVHPRIFVPIDRTEWNSVKGRIFRSTEYQTIRDKSSKHMLENALLYLIEGNTTAGRSAVSGILNWLRNTIDYSGALSPLTMRPWAQSAIIYDWCYDLVSLSQRNEMISIWKQLANQEPPYYPIQTHYNVLSSHHIEGYYWHQIISGLACYDEDQGLWNGSVDFFFSQHQPAQNWMNEGGVHPQQGYAGRRHNFIAQTEALFYFLTGKHAFDSSSTDILDQFLYFMYPDATQVRTGDNANPSGMYSEYRWTAFILSNIYNRPEYRLIADYAKSSANAEPVENVLDIVTRQGNDAVVPTNGWLSLPNVRYFGGPIGPAMVAKTTMDVGALKSSAGAVTYFKSGNYLVGNHQHMDFGDFAFYHKGKLSGATFLYQIDTGSSSRYGSSFWKHYYKDGISKNVPILYNPNAVDGDAWDNPQHSGAARYGLSNGYQPYKLATVQNKTKGYHYANPLYSDHNGSVGDYNFAYLSTDLTPAYQDSKHTANPDRATKLHRHFVSFNRHDAAIPVVNMVYDIVEITDYMKNTTGALTVMPLHVHNVVFDADGDRYYCDAAPDARTGTYDGRMFGYTLLPGQKEYKVENTFDVGFGAKRKRYSYGTVASGGGTEYLEELYTRLDTYDKSAGNSKRFLRAWALTDKTQTFTTMPDATRSDLTAFYGASLLNCIWYISKDGSLQSSITFTLSGTGTYQVVISTLQAGKYTQNGVALPTEVMQDRHTLYLELAAGTYTITKV